MAFATGFGELLVASQPQQVAGWAASSEVASVRAVRGNLRARTPQGGRQTCGAGNPHRVARIGDAPPLWSEKTRNALLL
jgi:hypothetical protein